MRACARLNAVNEDLVVPLPRPINYSLLKRLVHCAHDFYPSDASEFPRFPAVALMEDIYARVMENLTWIGCLVLVFPEYSLPTIYQFSFEATLVIFVAIVMHLLLPVINIGLLPPHLGKWHAEFMTVLLRRGICRTNVHIISLRILPSTHSPDGPVMSCMQITFLLGNRSYLFS